jgi:hypothetical protein
MIVGIGRSWRRAPGAGTDTGPIDAASAPGATGELADDARGGASPVGEAGIEGLPEQPVPLAPIGSTAPDAPAVAGGRGVRRVIHGVVLPAGRSRSLLAALPIPRVPRRAIFAVGICAGLAAPSIVKQVAGRALLATTGRGSGSPGERWESATMEIIRVTYASPGRGQAAETIGKLLEQLRR